MRKLFRSLLVMLAFLMSSCATKDDISKLQSEIDLLKSDKIASVESQLSSIKSSISKLETADSELKGYTSTLQKQFEDLAKADEVLSKSVDALKGESAGLALILESFQGELNAKLGSFQASLTTLGTKVEKLEEQMASLQSYSEELRKTKDWVSATFATLEQNTAATSVIVGIQTTLSGVKSGVAALEKSWAADKEELQSAIGTLKEESQGTLDKTISDVDSAISTAKDEVEKAYTKTLAEAIGATTLNLKTWVNSQLSGYYTIAATDAALETLKAKLEGEINAQKVILERLIATLKDRGPDADEEDAAAISILETEVSQMVEANATVFSRLQAELDAAQAELVTGYKDAIKEAIESHDGQIDGKLKATVNSINKDMGTKVSAVRADLDALDSRLVACETEVQKIRLEVAGMREKIDQILSKIQSIEVIPNHAGKQVSITEGYTEIVFSVHPEEVVESLVKSDHKSFSLDAMEAASSTIPNAFVNVPTHALRNEDGKLIVTVDGSALPEGFYSGDHSMIARLKVTAGATDRTSNYFTLHPVVEYVDLGLSVKWATANLGANSSSENGSRFAWGDVAPYEDDYRWGEIDWSDYKYYSDGVFTKYCNDPAYGIVDNRYILEAVDDAASYWKGGSWRTPTNAEFVEIRTHCKWETIVVDGKQMNKVSSTTNGNYIILPALGYHESTLYSCHSSTSSRKVDLHYVRPVFGETKQVYSGFIDPEMGGKWDWNK